MIDRIFVCFIGMVMAAIGINMEKKKIQEIKNGVVTKGTGKTQLTITEICAAKFAIIDKEIR